MCYSTLYPKLYACKQGLNAPEDAQMHMVSVTPLSMLGGHGQQRQWTSRGRVPGAPCCISWRSCSRLASRSSIAGNAWHRRTIGVVRWPPPRLCHPLKIVFITPMVSSEPQLFLFLAYVHRNMEVCCYKIFIRQKIFPPTLMRVVEKMVSFLQQIGVRYSKQIQFYM